MPTYPKPKSFSKKIQLLVIEKSENVNQYPEKIKNWVNRRNGTRHFWFT